MNDIETTVCNFVKQHCEVHGIEIKNLDAKTPLLEEGLIDSISLAELIQFIESTYSITLGEDSLAMENFQTINLIETLIRKLK